jgi:hypothetical protein
MPTHHGFRCAALPSAVRISPNRPRQSGLRSSPSELPAGNGTDRGRSYEDKSFCRVKQQKCLAHLQRTLSEVLAHKKGRARDLAEGTREWLRFGVRLWEEYHWGSREELTTGRRRYAGR